MGDEAGGLGARFQMLSVRSTPMAATRALLRVDAGPRRRVVDVADSALLAVARIADNVGHLRRESASSETLRPPDVTWSGFLSNGRICAVGCRPRPARPNAS